MTDLGTTITPKSDQMNADDLVAGPITIRVTKVSGTSDGQQPIAINYEGDAGKPYKPCKSMRRVLVQLWGRDGAAYTGRSMTLYRDDDVKFGGIAVGGIRISHMTDIDKEITIALTASKTSRKPFTVKPLKVADKEKPTTTDLATRRSAAIKYFGDLNVSVDRILAAVEKSNTDDIGEMQINKLNALRADIKAGTKSLLDAFPEVVTDRATVATEPADNDVN